MDTGAVADWDDRAIVLAMDLDRARVLLSTLRQSIRKVQRVFQGAPLQRGDVLILSGMVWVGVWLTALAMVGGMQPAHEEGGVLELTQAAILGSAVVLAAVAALRLPPGRYRAWGGMLMLVALVAYAREADFHTVLNPRYLGEWGIRYRADWWLNGQVSLGLKLGWAVTLATPVAVLGLLLRASRAQPVEALRQRKPFAWLALSCVGLYAVGYAMDDLLGRGQFAPTWLTMFVEEGSELVAAVVVLLMCVPSATDGRDGV